MEKNDNVRFLRSLFKTLEWITILGLFVVGGCFVQKVWIAYQSKETSVKHYTEKLDKLVPPTVTFCFDPMIKKSVTEKYNLTFLEILGYGNYETNLSLIDEGLYQIGRDFNVSSYIFTEGVISTPKYEEILTLYNGKCFKISPITKLKEMEYYIIDITLIKDQTERQTPKINFYFTSEENSYEIITSQSVSGTRPVTIKTKYKESTIYNTNLQILKHKKLDFISKCGHGSKMMTCAAQK